MDCVGCATSEDLMDRSALQRAANEFKMVGVNILTGLGKLLGIGSSHSATTSQMSFLFFKPHVLAGWRTRAQPSTTKPGPREAFPSITASAMNRNLQGTHGKELFTGGNGRQVILPTGGRTRDDGAQGSIQRTFWKQRGWLRYTVYSTPTWLQC